MKKLAWLHVSATLLLAALLAFGPALGPVASLYAQEENVPAAEGEAEPVAEEAQAEDSAQTEEGEAEPVAEEAQAEDPAQTEDAQPEDAASTQEVAAPDLTNELKALEGVTSVEALDVSQTPNFIAKYLITFKQPLDWKNESAGTFNQRVEVGIVKDAVYNVMETEGSYLQDESLNGNDIHELCTMLGANYIRVEHRFFGKSVPKGLSNDKTDLWQYLTSTNAAEDLHHVFRQVSQVLEGKWVATGTGRGGEVCASYAYYHPDDMAVYVPYVAPFSSGIKDERFYKYLYTSIGEARFGAEKAKEYRELVTTFQVELMRNKEQLAQQLLDHAKSEPLTNVPGNVHSTFRNAVDKNKLYDAVVLELASYAWSSATSDPPASFEQMKQILAMPTGTDEEKAAKIAAELDLLVKSGIASKFAANSASWPYYVGVFKEYGLYAYDFSYVRAACEKADLKDALTVKAEDEANLLATLVLTPEQQKAFTYDSTFYRGILDWIDDTTAHLMFVYDTSDPWYSLRMPNTDNVRAIFVMNSSKSSAVRLKDFTENEQKEHVAVLTSWIDAAPEPNTKAKEAEEDVAEDVTKDYTPAQASAGFPVAIGLVVVAGVAGAVFLFMRARKGSSSD